MDGYDGGGWDEPGGHDDLTGDVDPGLPGDDLIFLAMLDEEEQRRRAGYTGGYGSAGGCCGCALPVAVGLAVAGVIGLLAR